MAKTKTQTSGVISSLASRMGIFTILAMLLLSPRASFAQPTSPTQRDIMWKQVNEAIEQGLPKTAVERLAPIIESALQDKAYAAAIKAVAQKITLNSEIEGGRPEQRILMLQAELPKMPQEMVPMLRVLLGNWYWSYFEQNRWRFGNRTNTAAVVSDDFQTWDLQRLFLEIDKNYDLAMQDAKSLQSVPIADYDDLLPKGSSPDSYRPTLFDFVAFEAIEFYSLGEQAGTKAEDSFEIDAASAALGSMSDFLGWAPVATETYAPKLKAIQLYQQLLRFHQQDADNSALLQTELLRIRFCHANAVGEEKVARTLALLKSFAESHSKHPLSASARHSWAQLLVDANEMVAAREVALQGRNAFPDSPGGKNCHNLIESIEAKSVSITTDRVWTDPMPSIRIQYKNIRQVHFRAIEVNWTERLDPGRWMPNQINEVDREKLLQKPAALSWKVELPATDDYLENAISTEAPKGLKPGYYLVVASVRPDFADTDNAISVCDVWVSNLAVVVRQAWGENRIEGFVLNAKSGEPIANAKVSSFVRDNRNGKWDATEAASTDSNGKFAFSGATRSMLFLASHAGNQLSTMSEHSIYAEQPQPKSDTRYVLFTDRAIYRPGQTIFFKGIALLADSTTGKYATVPRKDVTIFLRDINNNEIAKLFLKSNDFGSFQGSFSIPRDRGTGAMTLQIADGFGINQSIQVEEYKRPKFEVTIEPPKEASKLDVETSLAGKATSYTGAAVNGAKVRYRVTRSVRWPRWYMTCFPWRMPPGLGQSQEIAHGFSTTETDGTFQVAFVPRPDRSVPESDQPTFEYMITADVTDGTGETRTASKSISVGYTALELDASAKDWQTTSEPVAMELTTSTLDGKGLTAKGKVTLYRLIEPTSITRSSMLRSPYPMLPRRPMGAGPGQLGKPAPKAKNSTPEFEFDGTNPSTWAHGDAIESKPFESDAEGKATVSFGLARGFYRAMVESQDAFGKPVRAEWNLRVVDPASKSLGLKIPNLLDAPKWQLEPGEKLQAIWGTGYDRARAFVEIERDGKVLKSYWTKPELTQAAIEQIVDESMRGGFTVRTTMVRENRAYMESRTVDVPWTNKELSLKWDRFVSKLEPAASETFTLTISGPNATKATAEMVAGLYDASLDAYLPHQWMKRFDVFRREASRVSSVFNNSAAGLYQFRGSWEQNYLMSEESFRRFPEELRQAYGLMPMMADGMAFGAGGMGGGAPGGMPRAGSRVWKSRSRSSAPMAQGMLAEGETADMEPAAAPLAMADSQSAGGSGDQEAKGPSLSDIPVRSNLNETAFFFPQLLSDQDGVVKLQFKMPEALTKWRFLGFAHDAQMRSGFLEGSLVTAKDLMVQPNPPRFLREGDAIEFSVKVSNQSDKVQSGKVALHLSDARTEESVDIAFQNQDSEKAFEIPAKQSKSFTWLLQVPEGAYPILYKAVGGTDKISDGEQGMLPVLSKRMLVTESIPLPIRGKTTREFEFKKLLDSKASTTLKHQSLSLQMTSQPAWYAVLALPYLMEYPYQCSEQTFNRLYANALAKHIALNDPKVRRVFDTWRQIQPQALESPLSKNQDLKTVMIEETPWLNDAQKESEARRNVGLLFEENRLALELTKAMKQLTEMQRENGMWPWFPGGPDNEYLSLYIVTGFGRLKNLKVEIDETPALRAIERLDGWMREMHDRIQRDAKDPETNHLSTTIALYLYGRSFFLETMPIADNNRTAVEYWKRQAAKYWLAVGNRLSQAHIALGLKRMGDLTTAKSIVASLKERSVSNEEMGMFWRDTENSWWWYHAPIESQALMIEALDEVTDDSVAVEDCKVWLLKQKQTQNWKTTKGTADAVYAILLRGSNLLSSDALVEVSLAGEKIVPEGIEAGTGFYSQRFSGNEVRSEMGTVTLKKVDDGVAWGSLHWQYLEDISKITPHDGTPLQLEKKLMKRTLTKTGPVLESIEQSPLAVGDEVVCRIVLRSDRDMEYVHLKDYRGSGTEPVNVLSQYKFQDGLAYYESTRDTASHFFIDYLPKGTYVFEYSIRIQHAGKYPSGIANIECMYAPEFNSHSESIMMEVR